MSKSKLTEGAQAYLDRFGYPRRTTPGLPPREVLLIRQRILIEEFFEILAALHPGAREWLETLEESLQVLARKAPLEASLPALAHEIVDLQHVLASFLAELGVEGEEISEAIWAANLQRVRGPTDWKPIRPAGWVPPDVPGILRKQGWDET